MYDFSLKLLYYDNTFSNVGVYTQVLITKGEYESSVEKKFFKYHLCKINKNF